MKVSAKSSEQLTGGKRHLVGLSSRLDCHYSDRVASITRLGKLHSGVVLSRGEGEVVDLDGLGGSVIKDTSEV